VTSLQEGDTRQLEGVYVPLITPFAADGGVALEALEQLGHEYLDAGCTGLVALGTTGETTALDADEQRAVIDICARVCAERDAQLIVGAGTNSTAKTIAAVERLAGTPALVATLIVVPYYVRPSEAGVVAHFRAVADASPVPVVVYNIPVRTGRNLGPAGMLELASLPSVIGVKQAVGGLDEETLQILARAPRDFAVLGGDDPFLLPTVLMGGAGAICASAHVCTERFVAMIDCGLAGKVDDARAHAVALLPVVQACFAEPNPSVFKGVLHAQGRIPTPDVRLPLVPASAGAVDTALAAVEAAR
jgi:4-hydroxy-tetrahydrodipicolinate synthase